MNNNRPKKTLEISVPSTLYPITIFSNVLRKEMGTWCRSTFFKDPKPNCKFIKSFANEVIKLWIPDDDLILEPHRQQLWATFYKYCKQVMEHQKVDKNQILHFIYKKAK